MEQQLRFEDYFDISEKKKECLKTEQNKNVAEGLTEEDILKPIENLMNSAKQAGYKYGTDFTEISKKTKINTATIQLGFVF